MVTITAEVALGNDAEPIGEDMTAWTVTLYRSDSEDFYAVPFFTGSGITEDPTAADVLERLTLDYFGWQTSDGFEDWARECGYDPDSRKAEATYRRVERQCAKFRRWGSDLIPSLMDMIAETGDLPRGEETGAVVVATVQEIAAR